MPQRIIVSKGAKMALSTGGFMATFSLFLVVESGSGPNRHAQTIPAGSFGSESECRQAAAQAIQTGAAQQRNGGSFEFGFVWVKSQG
jgi:hypothetical protein